MSESPRAAATAGTAPLALGSATGPAGGGMPAALGAFVIWGLFPLYLELIEAVPPVQIIAHRIAWSCLLLLAVLGLRGELGSLGRVLANPGVVGRLAATALLISTNWLTYVWAVQNAHVVETSLGYYINPLLNVVLGVVVLSERLNRAQWTAVGLAAAGVLYLTLMTGRLPWIALVLAASFGLYGLIRKTARVEALPGLTVETLLLAPVAIGYLVWCEAQGLGTLGHSGIGIDLLLAASGPLTALPLFLFAFAARRIPYSTVGVIQYIAPTLQLACGVLVFGEPFDRSRAVGFALIWVALLIYAADGLWRARRQSAQPA